MSKFNIGSDCQVVDLHVIYDTYFKDVDIGTFVEVGAYDGRSWSNTCCLADIGWKGLYIEPITEYADLCKYNHIKNNVIVENCAVGIVDGENKFYVGGGLTTSDELVKNAQEKMFGKDTYNVSNVIVKTHRLESIFKKHEIPLEFDLLVVDTEGSEHVVFDSFNLGEYTPKMIIVELCDVHPSFNEYELLQTRSNEVRKKIIANGYKEVYVDCINTIFVYDSEKINQEINL
jgi:FkbM family methyltransferase